MAEQKNEAAVAELEAILAERLSQEFSIKDFFDVVLVTAIVSDVIKKMPASIDRPTHFLEEYEHFAKSKSKRMPEESEDVDEYIAKIEQIREAMKRNQKEIDELKAETRSLISELMAA